MRVLFVSGELIAGNLAFRLKLEGCEVRLFVEHPEQQSCLDGFVEKTRDWRKDLAWVGKEGLIVFDDVGYGKIQDELRHDGYRVVGGSEGGDRLELDRCFAQSLFSDVGMRTVPIINFKNPSEAASYVEGHPAKWVVKQNNHQSALNYVGSLDDGRDVLSILEIYERNGVRDITLQKRLEGIEVSINRYFNGKDWVGPCEITLEHKSLFNDNLGPKTGEMGNLMWYGKDEGKLFLETLDRLKPYLREVDFRGDIDINSFISDDGVFPIEATSRFGCPITHSQTVMHISPWKDFLSAIADGEDYSLRHRDGYCVALTLALPPFPYEGSIAKEFSSEGLQIFFSEALSKDEMENIHFEGVFLDDAGKYYVSHSIGYTMFITGHGKSVADARSAAYSLAKKVVVPKIFYRTDIGLSFMSSDKGKLEKQGWI